MPQGGHTVPYRRYVFNSEIRAITANAGPVRMKAFPNEA